MPIISVTSDPDACTLTLVGEYQVPVERLWEAWHDPRQIERFWGPPGWPATFLRHDMTIGGRTEYVMTGPDGDTSAGYWTVTAIDPGRSFDIVDGFADGDGASDDSMPTSGMRVSVEPTDSGSRMTMVSTFADLASMEQLLEMGMQEGITMALGQIDDTIADLAAFAADRSSSLDLLGATGVRVSRVVRGSVEQVWRAHHEPELVQQWMLGPTGWTMPVCQVGLAVGDVLRYEWESDDGTERFGFEGEVLEIEPPHRSLTTERMTGTDHEPSTNELTLRPYRGGTLLTMVITYPNVESRAAVLETGMVDGMEASYARLESLIT